MSSCDIEFVIDVTESWGYWSSEAECDSFQFFRGNIEDCERKSLLFQLEQVFWLILIRNLQFVILCLLSVIFNQFFLLVEFYYSALWERFAFLGSV